MARPSQWPHGLRLRSAASRLLRLWVRIPPGAWIFVCCECCVLSSRGLCDGLINRPEESYRMWCAVVCDLETSWMRRPWPTGGLWRQNQTSYKRNRLDTEQKHKDQSGRTVCRSRFEGQIQSKSATLLDRHIRWNQFQKKNLFFFPNASFFDKSHSSIFGAPQDGLKEYKLRLNSDLFINP